MLLAIPSQELYTSLNSYEVLFDPFIRVNNSRFLEVNEEMVSVALHV
jgi:hypothetical protein